jgi:CRP/FNR family cyclic AMP-dependent transcriptional regulator
MSQQNRLKQLFESANHSRFYPKGSMIFLRGSVVDEAYFIAKGLVKIYNIDNSGNQHTVALFSENHVMPISWPLLTSPQEGAIFYYQAIIDTECFALQRSELYKFLEMHSSVCFKLIDNLTKSYINSTARIQKLQHSNVAEKVDFILYYIAQLFGRKANSDDLVQINAPITHQEIADLAGLTRESVSRQMSKQKYHSIIYTKKGKTFINLQDIDTRSMPKVYSLEI